MDKIKLSSICDIQSGGTPSRGKAEFWNGGTIPWVKIGDFTSKHIKQTTEMITPEGLASSSAKLFPKGTILYTIFATLGEIAILDIDACTNQAIAGLTLHDKRIDKEYLVYFLKSLKVYVNEIGRGVAQNNINMSILREFEVPMRPLHEQRQIAQMLLKAEEMIAARQQQLSALDALVKARFVEMFGDPESNTKNWEIKTLDSLCKVGSSKRIYQSEQSDSGVPFLRISDLVYLMDNNKLISDLYIPEERYEELLKLKQVPKVGDILVTSRGTLGRCYIVNESDKFYFQDGMISWLYDYSNLITPLYISYLFSMPGFRKQIDGLQVGSTVAYLSIAMLKKLLVMIPPIELQTNFYDFVAQVDKSKVAVKKSLDEAQLLFDSLMQMYFG